MLAAALREGLPPLMPMSAHALVATGAAIAEAEGDHETACHGYADAAARYGAFEMPWEQVVALVGHGRSLTALGRTAEAVEPLRSAAAIVDELRLAPGIFELEGLAAPEAASGAERRYSM